MKKTSGCLCNVNECKGTFLCWLLTLQTKMGNLKFYYPVSEQKTTYIVIRILQHFPSNRCQNNTLLWQIRDASLEISRHPLHELFLLLNGLTNVKHWVCGHDYTCDMKPGVASFTKVWKIRGHGFVSAVCEASLNQWEVLFLTASFTWITTNEWRRAKSPSISLSVVSVHTTILLFNGKQSKQQKTGPSTVCLNTPV